MERYTYFEGGKCRVRVGNAEYCGPWVDRLAAYEDTGLKPEEIMRLCKMDKRARMAGLWNEEDSITTLNVMQSQYSHIRQSDAEWGAIEAAKEAIAQVAVLLDNMNCD